MWELVRRVEERQVKRREEVAVGFLGNQTSGGQQCFL